MQGRILQRNEKILLQAPDAVEHGVAVGVERVAGFDERVAAGEVMVERFAVLRALFAVVNGKAAKLRRNKVTPALQIFQQQRRAQLLRRADGFTVEARIFHQLQCLARRAVELREGGTLIVDVKEDALKKILIKNIITNRLDEKEKNKLARLKNIQELKKKDKEESKENKEADK